MLIEADQFPVVRIHYDRETPPGTKDGLDMFEDLLDRGATFRADRAAASTAHEDSHEERKRVTIMDEAQSPTA